MPSAFAQWKQRVTVAAPFEFAVDNTVLPAGTHAVLLNAQTHGVMLLNREAQVSATAHSHDIFLIASGVAAQFAQHADPGFAMVHGLEIMQAQPLGQFASTGRTNTA